MITTVKEIRQKLPLADVYELRPDAQYLVLIDPRQVNLGSFNWPAGCGLDISAVVIPIQVPPGGELRDALAIYELEKKGGV